MALSGSQITRNFGASPGIAYEAFVAKAEASLSVVAPDIYAYWDIDLELIPRYAIEADMTVNFTEETEIKPRYKAEING